MKNNSTKKDDLHQTNVRNEFSCAQEDCRRFQTVKYIAMTSTTPSRRITMHIESGAIKIHMRETHIRLTKEKMTIVPSKNELR